MTSGLPPSPSAPGPHGSGPNEPRSNAAGSGEASSSPGASSGAPRRSPSAWLAQWGAGAELEWGHRCRARWRERALLVDLRRLQVRSLARLAFERALDEGADFAALMLASIDRSIEDLLRNQEQDAWQGAPQDPSSDLQRLLAREFGLRGPRIHAALCAFNACDAAAREAFFDCCLEGATPAQHAARRGLRPVAAEEALRRAFAALGADGRLNDG